MMTIKEFQKKFQVIQSMDFVKSKRKGPTGIGYTLECLLGIEENNIALPDLGNIELKAHRSKSNTLITLFTFNNKVWKIPPLDAIRKYGSKDNTGRLGLYFTMSLTPNSAGLFLDVRPTSIAVKHTDGTDIAEWQLHELSKRFQEKIPALLLVSAFCEERGGSEYFRYYRAQLMRETAPDVLYNQFKEENIVVDLRLHDNETSARNHGTGFRCYEEQLPKLFKMIKEIE